MSFTLYPDTDDPVEIGGSLAVLEGYLDVMNAIGEPLRESFPRLIDIVQLDGADVSREWAVDAQREAAALLRVRSSVLGPAGAWLLRRLIEALPDDEGPVERDAVVEVSKADAAEWARLNDSLLEPAAKAFRPKIHNILAGMYKHVVSAKRRGKRSGSSIWEARADSLRPLYERTIRHAMDDLAEVIGKAPHTSFSGGPYRYGRVDASGNVSVNVGAMVRDRLGRLADAIGGAHDRLKARLDRKKGWTADELDEFLDDELDGLAGEESFESGLALSEAGGSISMGRIGAFAEAGIEMGKWLSKRDNRVRDTHRKYNASKPRPVGFNYAKLTRGKYRLRWPYDEECDEVSEIANCRCFLVPAA